jgi:uncharacterized coiled-coil DUF342 family protein
VSVPEVRSVRSKTAALREHEHRLRNELWGLMMRRDLAIEETQQRKAALTEAIAEVQATLAAIGRRRGR